ncbi:DUF6378 domain-containing protein [Rhodococcus sp. NPDC055024]
MPTDVQRATTDLRQHPHAQFFRDNPTFEPIEETTQRRGITDDPRAKGGLMADITGIYEPVHTTPNPLTVLAEADKIVNGSRQIDYGTGEKNLTRIAAMWSAYLGTHISPRQVSMMMVLLKVSRDAHKEKRDNLVDLAGYAALAEQVSQ